MLFDLYVHTDGWLQRLDPRTKIALVLCGAALFVAMNHLLVLLALLALIHVMLLSSRVPLRQIGWVWRQLLRVVIIIVLIWPFFASLAGPEIVTLGPFTVTWTSVWAGLATATRVVGMSLLFFVILFTTRQNELVRGLVRLGLPFEWGLTLSMALRFIPTFSQTAAQIRDAQAARGWQVDRGDIVGRLRGLTPVLVALIIDVLRTGDTLGMALAVRGVGSGRPRTVWRDISFRRADWVVLALIALVFAVLIYLRFAAGFWSGVDMKHVTELIVVSEARQQILLGVKQRGFGQGKVVGFGGKLEEGETVAEGAARELYEETGLSVAPDQLDEVAVLTFHFPARPDWGHHIHVFLARAWTGEPVGSEEITAEWHDLDAIPYDKMWDDARLWLPRILAGERLQATFTYADDNETVREYYFTVAPAEAGVQGAFFARQRFRSTARGCPPPQA